jgi:hypothetical protein
MADQVENTTKLSRKAQLESYDGCARLRPVWDEIASKYDAVITPSAVDEAPVGIARTGDPVSFLSLRKVPNRTKVNDSLSVPCGQYFRFRVSISPDLRERMVCQLD